MDYKNILLFLTAGVNIGLAFFIFFRNPKDKGSLFFSIVLFLIAAWSFEIAMFRSAVDDVSLMMWLKSFYATAALISLIFFFFAYYFPFVIQRRRSLTIFMHIVLAALLFALVIIFGTVKSINFNESGDHTVIFNYMNYILYTVYFCLYICSSFWLLFKKSRVSTSYQKKLILVVFWATLLSALAGSVFDLLLPFITYQYVWVGPLFTLAMVFIIVRYVFVKEAE